MLSSRWQCSRCLGGFLRMAAKPTSLTRTKRFQSTDVEATIDVALSPSLIDRARAVAAEHQKLSIDNAENYDITVAKRLGELGRVAAALKEYEEAQNSLSELHSLIVDPSSDNELRSLAQQDIQITTESLPHLASNLKSSLIPPHPFAHLPCLLEIRPGAGGSEASLFAHDLLTMYQSLCSRLGWSSTLESYTSDESAPAGTTGLSDAILEIPAPGSYDLLRTEAGVHRVQRIPATEKKGRTHTSAVSVMVLPSLPERSEDSEMNYEDPDSDYYIPITDVRSETMRARGAGGQHVNKTESAIRLTHIPSGIVVSMQEARSQHKNRAAAWAILRSKVAAKRREEREAEVANLRRSVLGGVNRLGREDKVRTYNFSQNRVTDHRSGEESNNLDDVLAGGENLGRIMESVKRWIADGEVEALVVEDEIRKRREQQEQEQKK